MDAVLDISIHAPREGGDPGRHRAASPGRWISIHAPREGGDRNLAVNTLPELSFQSTPPARGATTARYTSGSVIIFQSTPPREGGDCCTTRATLVTPPFQSTPPARGATPTEPMLSAMCIISIHAPREGGDLDAVIAVQDQIDISIHAPREGGDPQQRSRLTPQPDHFNPRPPRGGRRLLGQTGHRQAHISIHAPREGGDFPAPPILVVRRPISIHAPREGGDVGAVKATIPTGDFNPRPPRGGRLQLANAKSPIVVFQSTPPARGATLKSDVLDDAVTISIHAPREGGDAASLP